MRFFSFWCVDAYGTALCILLVRLASPADDCYSKHSQAEQNGKPHDHELMQSFFVETVSVFGGWSHNDWTAFGTIVIAVFTVVLAISTIGLWIVTKRSADSHARDTRESIEAAKTAANAAVESNRITQSIYIAENRPLIVVDVSVYGPLTYNINGANISLLVNATNKGKSIATNLMFNLRAIAPAIGVDAPMDPEHEFQKFIRENRERLKWSLGATAFPRVPIFQPVGTSIPNDELKRATQNAEFIWVTVFGSVAYRFAGSDKIHQTAFRRELQRANKPRTESTAKNRSPTAIFVDEGDIPREDLVLMSSPIHGDFAD